MMNKEHIGGIDVWDKSIRGNKIPGSTRVPTTEIHDFFEGETENLVGLDVGSGQGRSTVKLQETLGATVVALDLSHEGLIVTDDVIKDKVQASAEGLPFKHATFDFINVCGVMTNLVGDTPENARALRVSALKNMRTALNIGGCMVISDFGADHLLDSYDVNYKRHALITGEEGTIAVLKSGENFIGKTDAEVAAMRESGAVERFAHHYSIKELISLVQDVGFVVQRYTVEVAKTPTGKCSIENIILVATKTVDEIQNK